MKRLFQILVAIVFVLAGVFGAVPADAAKFYPARALTGGGEGALDAIDGALLATGDVAIIGTSDRDGYMYVLLATGDEESSPDVIAPDRNAGSKRWHLVQWGGNLDLARIQAALSNDFHNIGGTDDDVPEPADLDGVFTANGMLMRSGPGSYGAATQGTHYYAPGGAPVAIGDGGTGASLSDPDANTLFGWDDSTGGFRYITIGANLSYDSATGTLSAIAESGTGGSSAFADIITGTNTTATMTVGTGATVSYSGTGTINASQYRGVSLVDSTEFGYLDGVTSPLQAQLNGKAASIHAHAGADITSGTIDVARLPTGTTGTTVSLGNHTHSTYAPLSHAHSGADITSGIIGAAYLPLNAYNSAGIVASGNGQANMVWKTDASGNPAWRVDSTGSAPTFDAVATGTNVSSTMTVGSGASLVRSGTGIIDANRFLGVTSIDATEFGYLDGTTGSLQEQLDSKAASVHSHSAADLPLADDDGVTLGVCAFSSGGSFDVSGGIVGLNTNLTNIASNWTVDSSGNVSGMGTIEPTPTEHPQAVLYDSDAPGETIEEKAMAYLWGEYVGGADDEENSSAGIAARAAGAWADWIKYLAGAVYIYHDLDVDGDVTGKSFSVTQSASQAGQWYGSELSGNGTNYQAWEVADEITTSLILKFPDANPLANSIQIFGAPIEGKSTFAWLQIAGNSKYFGTDGSGTVGIHDLPAASSGLPEGGTEGQIIVNGTGWTSADNAAMSYTPTEYTPQGSDVGGHFRGVNAEITTLRETMATMINAFNALGLNAFFFTPSTPASYPYYSNTGTFDLFFTITDSSPTYDIYSARYQLDDDGYEGNSLVNTGGNIWRASLENLDEGSYTLQLEADDSKSPVRNVGESSEYTVVVDTTDPVINLSAGANPTTHDGSGNDTWDLQIGMITETYIDSIQYRLTVDGGDTPEWSTWSPTWTTTGISLPEVDEDLHIAVKVTDLASNVGTDGVTVVYSAPAGGCTGVHGNNATTSGTFQEITVDYLCLSQVTLSCGGTPTSINARTMGMVADGEGAVFVVYSDSGGAPGTRLWYGANDIYDAGQSEATTVLTDTSISEYTFSAGTYWIGIAAGVPGRVYGPSETGGVMVCSTDTWTDVFPVPPATAPTLTAGEKQLAIWLEFP